MIDILKWIAAVLFVIVWVMFFVYAISELVKDIKAIKAIERNKPKKKKEPVLRSVTEEPHILEYPKIKSVTCYICHCKYVGEAKHLRSDPFGSRFTIGINCPLCGVFNQVEFEEKES